MTEYSVSEIVSRLAELGLTTRALSARIPVYWDSSGIVHMDGRECDIAMNPNRINPGGQRSHRIRSVIAQPLCEVCAVNGMVEASPTLTHLAYLLGLLDELNSKLPTDPFLLFQLYHGLREPVKGPVSDPQFRLMSNASAVVGRARNRRINDVTAAMHTPLAKARVFHSARVSRKVEERETAPEVLEGKVIFGLGSAVAERLETDEWLGALVLSSVSAVVGTTLVLIAPYAVYLALSLSVIGAGAMDGPVDVPKGINPEILAETTAGLWDPNGEGELAKIEAAVKAAQACLV